MSTLWEKALLLFVGCMASICLCAHHFLLDSEGWELGRYSFFLCTNWHLYVYVRILLSGDRYELTNADIFTSVSFYASATSSGSMMKMQSYMESLDLWDAMEEDYEIYISSV